MNQSANISEFIFSDEFLSFGAMFADVQNDSLILASGGEISNVQKNNKEYFFVKDFYSNSFVFYYPQSIKNLSLSQTLSQLQNKTKAPHVSEFLNFDHLYANDFNTFKKTLDQLSKVVLISREEFKVLNFKEALKHFIFCALNFGTGFPYGYWNGDAGIIGATPELLFRKDGQGLETFALAGTAPAANGFELLNSKKDLHEHQIVIDDIEEKITPFCETILKEQTKLHPFKQVVHLKTDFKATLKPGTDIIELTSKMSPTAALGGYPMLRSLEFLKATDYAQTFSNRIFGSVMGHYKENQCTTLVMIRNIQWSHKKFVIECGGGVVSESILENELAEIDLKRSLIKKNYL